MAKKQDDDLVEDEDLDEEDDLEDDDIDSDEETELEDDEPDEEETEHDPDATSEDPEEAEFAKGVAGLASDVPVQVVAVLGKRTMSMQDLMKFHMGQVVELYRPANEMVDLVANGKIIAKGELVSIDGKLGVKIIKLI